MINTICVKLFLTFPRSLVINSGTGAWLQMIFAILWAYLIFSLSMRIYRVCGTKDIIDVSREAGGGFLAAVVGIILFCLLGINIGILMRVFPESIKMFLLPDTEFEWIVLIFVAASAFGAYMGFRAIANTTQALILPAIIIMIVFLVSLLGECRISNISPIFGMGIPTALKGWDAVSIFADIILLNLFLPHFDNFKEAEKSGKIAILVSGAIGLAITLIYTMTYPYPISSEILMPVYRLVRSVDVIGVFGKAESALAFMWCILTFISASAYIYEMAWVIKKAFSLEEHKTLIIPSAVIIGSGAMLDMNIVDVLKNERVLGAWAYIAAALLPALAAALYMIRRKKR